MSAFVLYVDDDAANLVVFEAAFRKSFPILVARSAAEALEIIATHEVAVLLTDQRMPGMSGVELMEKVQSEHPEIIRLLVTAYSDIDAAVDAINRGQVHLYLRKPWEPTKLKMDLIHARDRYLNAKRVSELETRLHTTERMYSLGVVAAGVAHEIRNPLSALSLNLELVEGVLTQDRLSPADQQRARLAIKDSHLAVKAIADITQSIELSTRSTVEGEVDLKEVIEMAARSIRGEARRRARVSLSLDEVPLVRGSRTRLGQVVLNLLVNALEAFDPGPSQKNIVSVRLRKADRAVEFEVADNGGGIEEGALKRIFDPFFTTKTDGGTGLGLAISRQIVEELNGSIDVTSQVGKGTSFVVKLPAALSQY